MEPESHLLSAIKPVDVWDHFYHLSHIPRSSGNERTVCQYICSLARDLGYEYTMDTAGGSDFGNIIVRCPATPGYESTLIVVFQSHLDMVVLPLERMDLPPDLFLDGTVLRARGSTLGADNGLAVAIALTLMTNTGIIHGPLELLFTVREESDMGGIRMLSDNALQGSVLINADTEGEGILTISSAGMGISSYHLPIQTERVPPGLICCHIRVTGGRGGHSGLDINTGRANVGQFLARFLYELSGRVSLHMVSISWGMVMNAIPAEADAIIFTSPEGLEFLKSVCSGWESRFAEEFGPDDGPLKILLDPDGASGDRIMTAASQKTTLTMLLGFHHGVHTMSRIFDGVVETSSNVALVRTIDDGISVTVSYRSSTSLSLDAIMLQCEAVASLAGAISTRVEKNEGWCGDPASPVLSVCREAFMKIYGSEPIVRATHGTIEAGYIREKYPAMDIISIGTAIRDFHVPTKADFVLGVDSDSCGERFDTAGMPRFWDYMKEILRILAIRGRTAPGEV